MIDLKNKRLFFISKYGFPFILIPALIGTALVHFFNFYVSLPFFLMSIFAVYFFRDPQREFCADALSMISPADGRVIEILDNVEDPLGGNDRFKKLSIFMSVLSVHVNRIPLDGKVSSVNYKEGSFYPADKEEASKRNESSLLALEHAVSKKTLYIKQISGILARRIVCWVNKGDAVQKGERFGIIKFGSRVEIFIPDGFEFTVKKGDMLKAAKSVIGRQIEEKK